MVLFSGSWVEAVYVSCSLLFYLEVLGELCLFPKTFYFGGFLRIFSLRSPAVTLLQ